MNYYFGLVPTKSSPCPGSHSLLSYLLGVAPNGFMLKSTILLGQVLVQGIKSWSTFFFFPFLMGVSSSFNASH